MAEWPKNRGFMKKISRVLVVSFLMGALGAVSVNAEDSPEKKGEKNCASISQTKLKSVKSKDVAVKKDKKEPESGSAKSAR